jgi:hypothetical protein
MEDETTAENFRVFVANNEVLKVFPRVLTC